MKKVCMPFIIGFGFFSMASVLTANAGFVSVTRTLSSDSSADISSPSNFDACNMHFSDFKYPALSDDEYFQKKSPISEWTCLYSGEAFEAGYDVQQVNNKGAVLVPLIIKLFMTTRIRYGNQFRMLHM